MYLVYSLSETEFAWCINVFVFKTLIPRIWFWTVSSWGWWQFCLSDAFIFHWRMRISWNSRPWFCVDSDSASSVSVLDLVCVCCWCLLFVLGIHKQHRSWSWIDAMVSSISWWSGFGDRNRFKEIPGMMDGFWTDDFRLAEDWWKFCFWRYSWSIAEISDGDGYGYESTISLWRVKHWRDNFVLRIIQNWIDSILRSSWKWIGSNWTFRDSYFGYV